MGHTTSLNYPGHANVLNIHNSLQDVANGLHVEQNVGSARKVTPPPLAVWITPVVMVGSPS